MISHSTTCRGALLALGLFFTGQAMAQNPADDFARRQSETMRSERIETLTRQTPRSDAPTLQPVPVGETSAACFEISRVVVEDAARLGSQIDAVTRPYANTCIGLPGITELLRAVTNVYLDRGYITSRAYVPEQDLVATRILRIKVVEGVLEKIEINGKEASGSTTLATAFPGMLGETANMRDVEQGLDQLNRLRSNKAKSEFLPGTAEGSSTLNISLEQGRPWHVTVGNNNLGQESTGYSKSSVAVTYDDLLGLNDLMSFSYERSGPDYPGGGDGRGSSNSYSGNVSIPWGYWTVSLNGSWYDYKSMVPAAFSDVETTGTSGQAGFDIERVVQRGADSLTKVHGGLLYKETDNFLLGQKLEVGSRRYTVGSFGVSHSQRMFGGLWNFDAQIDQGLGILGAIDPGAPAAGEAEPRFTKLYASLSAARPVDLGFTAFELNSQFNMQLSGDNLLGSEQMALGGWSTVRGSRESKLFGNNGFFVRNEVSWRTNPWQANEMMTSYLGELRPYLGFDYGQIFRQTRFDIGGGEAYGFTAGARLGGGRINLDTGFSALHASRRNGGNEQLFFINLSTQW